MMDGWMDGWMDSVKLSTSLVLPSLLVVVLQKVPCHYYFTFDTQLVAVSAVCTWSMYVHTVE